MMKNHLFTTKISQLLFRGCLLALFFIPITLSWGQTTVFSDDFNRGAVVTPLSNGGTPTMTYTTVSTATTAGTSTTNQTSGTDYTLSLAGSGAAGRTYVYAPLSTFSSPFNVTLSSNVGLVTWTFNLRTNRSTGLSGFDGGQYTNAVILACNNSDFLNASAKGYVVYLTKGTKNKINIGSFTAGLSLTSNVTSFIGPSTELTSNTAFVSVKVTYLPSTNTWSLYVREDSATPGDPTTTSTQVGSSVQYTTNTAVAMTHFGYFWNHSTGTSSTDSGRIDNFKVVVNSPTITTPSPVSFTGLNYGAGSGPSSAQFFTTGGVYLTSNITVAAPTNFEVSTDNITFSSSSTLSATSGTVSSSTIYVRLIAGLSAGNYSGTINITATNAPTKTVTCSGEVSSTPTIAVSTASLSAFANTDVGAYSASQSFTVNGSALTANITVTAPANFQVSTDTSNFSTSLTLPQSGGSVALTTIYTRFSPTGSDAYSGTTIAIASTGATAQNVSVSGYPTYYYKGSGDLGTTTNWNGKQDGTGTLAPSDFLGTNTYYKFLTSATSTATNPWTASALGGANSKIIVGDPSVPPVTLTIVAGAPIAAALNTVVVDIVGASGGGSNSVVLQDTATPVFGTLHALSEVHYQANISTGTSRAYGKIVVDGGTGTTTTFSGSPTVQTSFRVEENSTAQMGNGTSNFLTVNSGATVTINGTLKTQKSAGFVSSNSGSSGGSIQFTGTQLITLGSNSTIDFNRGVSGASGAQTIDARTDYANLVLSNSGFASNKTFAAGTLSVSGALTVVDFLGSITQPASTTINYTGSAAQTLPSAITTYSNLGFSGNSTKTINSNTTVTGVLTVGTGATLETGDALTLKSDAAGTARVAQVFGNITGKVTVERYIPGKRAWRALTAPVIGTSANSIFANWQNNGTQSAGTGVELWSTTGGNNMGTGPNNSILKYNSSGTSGAWNAVTNTNDPLFGSSINNAFMVFVTGPYATTNTNVATGFANTTLRATGALIVGQKDYAGLPSGVHTLIGNPYACPISPSSLLTGNTNFGNNLWVWDAKATGNFGVGAYNTYDKTANQYTNITNATPLATTPDIQSGQAFFVKATSGTATFTILESYKTSVAANTTVLRTGTPPELVRVGLYKQENNEWNGRDGAMTVLLADADANQAPNKMNNGSENIVFTKNGASFSSDHHLPLVASDVLNVKVWNATVGANYKLKINTEDFVTTNLDATLEDLFTNTRTPLALDGTAVEYPFTVTADALSTGDRFRIVFQSSTLGTNNPKANGFSIVPNPVTGDAFQVNLGALPTGNYTYTICNTLGQEVEKGSINNAAQNTNYEVKMSNSATGIYLMKIKGSDNSVFTAKIIKK